MDNHSYARLFQPSFIEEGSSTIQTELASSGDSGSNPLAGGYDGFIDGMLVFVFAVATLSNTILLVVFYRRPGLRNLSNKFVINLLATNLISCWIILPILLYDTTLYDKSKQYQDNVTILLSCLIEGVTTGLFTASVTSVMLIGVDQYFAVIEPLRYHSIIRKHTACKLIVVCWIFSFICGLLGTVNSLLHNAYTVIYPVLFSIVIFLLPFILLCYIYICIYWAAHENSLRTRNNCSSSIYNNSNNELRMSNDSILKEKPFDEFNKHHGKSKNCATLHGEIKYKHKRSQPYGCKKSKEHCENKPLIGKEKRNASKVSKRNELYPITSIEDIDIVTEKKKSPAIEHKPNNNLTDGRIVMKIDSKQKRGDDSDCTNHANKQYATTIQNNNNNTMFKLNKNNFKVSSLNRQLISNTIVTALNKNNANSFLNQENKDLLRSKLSSSVISLNQSSSIDSKSVISSNDKFNTCLVHNNINNTNGSVTSLLHHPCSTVDSSVISLDRSSLHRESVLSLNPSSIADSSVISSINSSDKSNTDTNCLRYNDSIVSLSSYNTSNTTSISDITLYNYYQEPSMVSYFIHDGLFNSYFYDRDIFTSLNIQKDTENEPMTSLKSKDRYVRISLGHYNGIENVHVCNAKSYLNSITTKNCDKVSLNSALEETSKGNVTVKEIETNSQEDGSLSDNYAQDKIVSEDDTSQIEVKDLDENQITIRDNVTNENNIRDKDSCETIGLRLSQYLHTSSQYLDFVEKQNSWRAAGNNRKTDVDSVHKSSLECIDRCVQSLETKSNRNSTDKNLNVIESEKMKNVHLMQGENSCNPVSQNNNICDKQTENQSSNQTQSEAVCQIANIETNQCTNLKQQTKDNTASNMISNRNHLEKFNAKEEEEGSGQYSIVNEKVRPKCGKYKKNICTDDRRKQFYENERRKSNDSKCSSDDTDIIQTNSNYYRNMQMFSSCARDRTMELMLKSNHVRPFHHSSTRSSLKSTSSSLVNSLKHRISNASMFKYREESRAARISISVIIMALLSWLPFTILILLHSSLFNLINYNSYPSFTFEKFTILCLSCHFVITPILFAHRNKKIKKELASLWRTAIRCLCCRKRDGEEKKLRNSFYNDYYINKKRLMALKEKQRIENEMKNNLPKADAKRGVEDSMKTDSDNEFMTTSDRVKSEQMDIVKVHDRETSNNGENEEMLQDNRNRHVVIQVEENTKSGGETRNSENSTSKFSFLSKLFQMKPKCNSNNNNNDRKASNKLSQSTVDMQRSSISSNTVSTSTTCCEI